MDSTKKEKSNGRDSAKGLAPAGRQLCWLFGRGSWHRQVTAVGTQHHDALPGSLHPNDTHRECFKAVTKLRHKDFHEC